MTYDYTELKREIKRNLLTNKEMAQKIGMSESHMSQKLHNNYAFTQDDIMAMVNVLGIKKKEIGEIFFTPLVEKTQ